MSDIQKWYKHGVTIKSLISKMSIKQVGILYVNDTNLWEGLDKDGDLNNTTFKDQEDFDQLGNSLVAVGRMLKLETYK